MLRGETVFLVALLLVGYGLFGGIYALGGAAHDHFQTSDLDVSDDGSNSNRSVDDGSTGDEPAFEFADVSSEAGFDYEYAATRPKDGNDFLTNAGVYALDYNDDGWTDVLAIGGDQPAVFENTGGSFERANVLPELDREPEAAMVFDANDDGRTDILLLPWHSEPILFENTGDGFERAPADTFDVTLDIPIGATTADYDGDGCQDVYLVQYGDWSERLPNGKTGFDAPLNDDNGYPDYLFYGDCSGGFERATDAGIRGTRWTLAASSGDITGNGHVDIHVANEYNYDMVYVNHGNGTFTQSVLPEQTNRNSMSSELLDVNQDGLFDIFVTAIYLPPTTRGEVGPIYEMKARGNNLMVNQGNATFVDKAQHPHDANKGGWAWAAVTSDFDNDGDEDLFHSTRDWRQPIRDNYLTSREQRLLDRLTFYSYPVIQYNDNGTFREMKADEVGFREANGRGAIRLDYDRDGQMDVVVATTSEYLLYENRGESDRAIELRIENENGSFAMGSKVYVTGRETQWRQVRPGTDFLSQDTGDLHFGVGKAQRVDVRILRPDGREQTIERVRTGQRLVVGPTGVENATSLSG